MGDLDFVIDQLNEVLEEASAYANKDNDTKKAYVQRVKEKAIILFDIQKRPHTELASFIWNKLDEIQFSIAKPWFESIFTDDEKRNYSDKFSTEHFIEWKSNIKKNPISGQIQVEGITYSPDLPSQVKPKSLKPTTKSDEPTKNKYTDLINLIGDTASKLQTACDAIIQRYDENSELIESSLQPIKDLQKKYAEYYGKIANSKDVLDDRNKWGDFEKIKAKFLMDSGETIAHIAKLMDYSSKFGSIGILNNKELQNKITQLGSCPKCKANIYFEMNSYLKSLEAEAELEV